MALYPINVTYTPQIEGDHIICYQQTDPVVDGPNFCCMRDTTPSVVGVPKIFQIPDVAIPSCDEGGTASPFLEAATTTFNGYVYPACDLSEAHDLKTDWTAPVVFVVIPP
jgi:hypothetical protein